MISLNELRKHKEKIKKIALRYHATNIRVFGSVSRNDNSKDSDVDIMVKFLAGASLLDQLNLKNELTQLLHTPVDVVSDRGVNKYIADKIFEEALPL